MIHVYYDKEDKKLKVIPDFLMYKEHPSHAFYDLNIARVKRLHSAIIVDQSKIANALYLNGYAQKDLQDGKIVSLHGYKLATTITKEV